MTVLFCQAVVCHEVMRGVAEIDGFVVVVDSVVCEKQWCEDVHWKWIVW